MRICVLVKEVPDAAEPKRIDPATRRLDRSGERGLNPFDLHALEAARRIAEGGEPAVSEVLAVTMGPPEAERVLRRALSSGADRAILLSDDGLAGSDVNGTGHALARTLALEAPDLVLLGRQSADGTCSALAAVVAEHLGMPSLSQVVALELEGGALRCERQAEFGAETVRVTLPAVVSVAESLNEPRYPTLQGIVAARSAPVQRRTLADVGLAEDRVGHRHARALCTDFRPPPAKAPGRILEDQDPAATVAEVVAWLADRRLLA